MADERDVAVSRMSSRCGCGRPRSVVTAGSVEVIKKQVGLFAVARRNPMHNFRTGGF